MSRRACAPASGKHATSTRRVSFTARGRRVVFAAKIPRPPPVRGWVVYTAKVSTSGHGMQPGQLLSYLAHCPTRDDAIDRGRQAAARIEQLVRGARKGSKPYDVGVFVDRWEHDPSRVDRTYGRDGWGFPRARSQGGDGDPMRVFPMVPVPRSLAERIAHALGWKVSEVRSFSLASVRELVRPVDRKLAAEIDERIRSGRSLT